MARGTESKMAVRRGERALERVGARKRRGTGRGCRWRGTRRHGRELVRRGRRGWRRRQAEQTEEEELVAGAGGAWRCAASTAAASSRWVLLKWHGMSRK